MLPMNEIERHRDYAATLSILVPPGADTLKELLALAPLSERLSLLVADGENRPRREYQRHPDKTPIARKRAGHINPVFYRASKLSRSR